MSETGPLASEVFDDENARTVALIKAQYDTDLRMVMTSPSGRRFMARILFDTSGLLNLSFKAEPHLTSLYEGKRSVGIFLANECRRVAPDEFIAMQQEQFEDSRRRERQRQTAEEEAAKDR